MIEDLLSFDRSSVVERVYAKRNEIEYSDPFLHRVHYAANSIEGHL